MATDSSRSFSSSLGAGLGAGGAGDPPKLASEDLLRQAFEGDAPGYKPAVHSVRFLTPRPVAPQKPLFVFLPGMDGAGTLLRPQIDRLVPWFDIRCVAIAPDDRAEWVSLARQVVHLISDEVGEPDARSGRRRPVYLCGESFGGCLAMQALSLLPDLFERLILINPASSFRRLPWMQLGPLITRQLPNVAYRVGAKGLVPFLVEPQRVPPRDLLALENAMGDVPAQTAAWRMSLLSQFQVERLPLERMTHPVLLIAGECDRLLPSKRETQSLLVRFPNAQLAVLPESGHACLLETAVNFQQILRRQKFLPS